MIPVKLGEEEGNLLVGQVKVHRGSRLYFCDKPDLFFALTWAGPRTDYTS